MFNDSPSPTISSLLERFEQLNGAVLDLPIPFAASGDSESIWEITNNVCDRHDILHLC